jgi:hypothetical protein
LSKDSQLKHPGILLLDRTHQSKVTANLLSDLGVRVEVHKRHYLPDAPDPEWIVDAAQRGWIIISGDKGIELDGVNRRAVAQAKAKVFLLADTESRGAEWAASLVTARHRILQVASENDGPFFCNIEKSSAQHVRTPRFLEGGGPRPKEPTIMSETSTVKPIPTDMAAQPEISQDEFDFSSEG